mgnify:CR=1 FL=1
MTKTVQKSKARDMTQGSIWKQLLLFSLPLMAGNLFQQLYNTVDSIVVGNFVGKEALAAVGSVGPIINSLIGFFMGLSTGAGVIISQYYGAKRAEMVGYAVHTSIAFSLVAGVGMMIVGITAAPWALRAMSTPEDILGPATTYIRIYFLGVIGNLIYNMGAGILRAVGDSKRPLYFLIVSCLTNIVLDIAFVIGLHMGVAGAALATILSQALSAVLVLWVLMRTKDMHRLELRKIRFDGRMFRRIIRIGLPAGLQSVMYTSSNILIQSSVNALGTDTVAAWTAYSKIDSLFWMIVNAFGISITTFVGQNFGAGKYHRMRKSVSVCMIMSMVSSAVLIILMYSFAPWIYRLFTTDSAVIVHGVHMSRFLLPSYFIYVIIGILSGALRGTGKVLVPMLLTCGGVCSLRILWLFTAGQIYPGINTIMLSYPVSWSITAVLFIVYYFMKFPGKKKEN